MLLKVFIPYRSDTMRPYNDDPYIRRPPVLSAALVKFLNIKVGPKAKRGQALNDKWTILYSTNWATLHKGVYIGLTDPKAAALLKLIWG